MWTGNEVLFSIIVGPILVLAGMGIVAGIYYLLAALFGWSLEIGEKIAGRTGTWAMGIAFVLTLGYMLSLLPESSDIGPFV